MRNYLTKLLSFGMACLSLTLLLNINIVNQKNNLKILLPTQVHKIITPNEDPPW